MNFGFEPNGTMWLNCNRLSLSNEEMSQILNTFIENCKNISLLRQLTAISNFLTLIPHEIRLFPRLTTLNFYDNQIASIEKDDFVFSSGAIGDQDRIILFLDYNKIDYIEPGAFESIYI